MLPCLCSSRQFILSSLSVVKSYGLMFRYVVFCRFRVDAVLNILVLDTRFLFLSLRPSLILGRLCQRPLQRVNVSRIRLTVNLIHSSMFSFSSHPPSLEFSSVVREGREGRGGGSLLRHGDRAWGGKIILCVLEYKM